MLQDQIADMLTRIRNSILRSYRYANVRLSKQNKAIAEVLKTAGMIVEYEELPDERKLRIFLKYSQRKPIITKLCRLSKPGRRLYVSKDNIPYVKSGLGICVVSTSQGVMSDREARTKGLGGEILCSVS